MRSARPRRAGKLRAMPTAAQEPPPDAPPILAVTLSFAGGTLELRGLGPGTPPPHAACVWDPRTACYRAPAAAYAALRRALAAWRANQGRGVVVLPTGAGKTWVACLAIDDRRRSTLVIAPTLDLVRQW